MKVKQNRLVSRLQPSLPTYIFIFKVTELSNMTQFNFLSKHRRFDNRVSSLLSVNKGAIAI